jgi:hypothetical protein
LWPRITDCGETWTSFSRRKNPAKPLQIFIQNDSWRPSPKEPTTRDASWSQKIKQNKTNKQCGSTGLCAQKMTDWYLVLGFMAL